MSPSVRYNTFLDRLAVAGWLCMNIKECYTTYTLTLDQFSLPNYLSYIDHLNTYTYTTPLPRRALEHQQHLRTHRTRS